MCGILSYSIETVLKPGVIQRTHSFVEQRVIARTRQLIESHQPEPSSDTGVQCIHQIVT